MKNIFLILFTFSYCILAHGQHKGTPERQIHATSLFEFTANGNRFGIAAEYQIQIFGGQNNNYKLLAGPFEDFFVKNETDIEGISGTTISNIIGISLNNHFQLWNSHKWYISNTLYAGWGYRKTSARYTNPAYEIDRKLDYAHHYPALGAYWKAGFLLKHNLGVHVMGKTDFSRLIGRYQPTIFERPGFMFGIGLLYKWEKN